MPDRPDHHEIAWPYIWPGCYAQTWPLPFTKPVILGRPDYFRRRDYQAHELVHVRQIHELGRLRYLWEHGKARANSLYKWVRGSRAHGMGLKGFLRLWYAREEPIEAEAYEAQKLARLDMLLEEGLAEMKQDHGCCGRCQGTGVEPRNPA